MSELFCLILILSGPETDGRLAAVLKQHERYLQAFRSLRVELVADVSRDGGKSWKRHAEGTWRKDGSRHRFTSTLFVYEVPEADGSTSTSFDPYFLDMFFDEEHCRELSYPASQPKDEPPSPSNGYNRIRAAIVDPPSWFGNRVGPLWLFFTADSRYSLPQHAEMGSKIRLVEKAGRGDPDLPTIELTPDYDDDLKYRLVLDPAKGYAIVQRETLLKRSGEQLAIHRVVESAEVMPGIHFPKRVRITSTRDDTVLDVRVTALTVNQPIADEAFVVKFPKGAMVVNQQNDEIYIWGEDEPALVFKSYDEFAAWEREQLGQGGGRPVLQFLLANAVLLTGVVLVILLRRRLLRRRGTA